MMDSSIERVFMENKTKLRILYLIYFIGFVYLIIILNNFGRFMYLSAFLIICLNEYLSSKEWVSVLIRFQYLKGNKDEWSFRQK